MAKRTLILGAFFSAVVLPGIAWAQDDPATKLEGLWRIDQAEVGTAEDPAIGKVIRIDRAAVASLSGGTCANPTFVATGVQTIEIRCLGQVLATAEVDGATPDTVKWTEPNIDVVLHRIVDANAAGDASPTESGGASDEGTDAGSGESQ
jgi:hypothetical protein